MEKENTFGDRLKQIRLERKLSQDEMAKILGTSKQVISRYEKNQRIPKVTVTARYAEILHLSLLWLMGKNAVKYIEGMSLFEDTLTYHWSWPLVEAYSAADNSTQKAVCAVLGVDYVSTTQNENERLAYEEAVKDFVSWAQPEQDDDYH